MFSALQVVEENLGVIPIIPQKRISARVVAQIIDGRRHRCFETDSAGAHPTLHCRRDWRFCPFREHRNRSTRWPRCIPHERVFERIGEEIVDLPAQDHEGNCGGDAVRSLKSGVRSALWKKSPTSLFHKRWRKRTNSRTSFDRSGCITLRGRPRTCSRDRAEASSSRFNSARNSGRSTSSVHQPSDGHSSRATEVVALGHDH